ncbi:protein bark beetle-like [Tubulanus polymorphus]|uniref:protein bark beetle-like n=1 Tax=Tubulanus polymorphus TaxID=672921 RepID=UPI003DA677C4
MNLIEFYRNSTGVMFNWSSFLLVILMTISSIVAETYVGGPIYHDTTLSKARSPYKVRYPLSVGKDAKVTIEPGVEMQFAPAVGFAINGTLIARGTPENRIVFTKLQPAGSNFGWPSDIRLVESFTVRQGRLQMFYKNRWRGVCTNYRNWTKESSDVACRQLGFEAGNFTFEPVADNETYYMLFENPQCSGLESSLYACPGMKSISLGKHVCDNQITAGLVCTGINPIIEDSYWKGLTFFNSTFKLVTSSINRRWNESASILEYVDIMYAGVNETRNLTAALSASPHPPALNNVRIMNNAFDGVNFTEVTGSVKIRNSEFSNNRGNGVNITSFFGFIDISGSKFVRNKGDGIRARLLDGVFHSYLGKNQFCQRAGFAIEQFPLILPGLAYATPPCGQQLTTKPGDVITASLMEVQVDPSSSGQLDFYDGRDPSHSLLKSIQLNNYTFHQAITTTNDRLYIKFSWKGVSPMGCRYFRQCLKFTLLLTSGKKKHNDIRISDSVISENLQSGLHLINMRSRIVAHNITVTNNSYGAGLRVYEGATDCLIDSSTFKYNERAGVNVTTTGGQIIVNRTLFESNNDHGLVTRYIHLNKTRIEGYHSVDVFDSNFQLNEGIGAFFGNYCGDGHISVNKTNFDGNGVGLKFESCQAVGGKSTNLTIAYNTFHRNKKPAVEVTPALRIYGKIGNNTFTQNEHGCIQIDNTDDYLKTREYRKASVNYAIWGNSFKWNYGWFVINLRLTHESSLQNLIFKENRLENNRIYDPFPGLNPRTRAAAVLLVSSSNIRITRNAFSNHVAVYEIATHLIDPSFTIDAVANYFHYVKTNELPDIETIDTKIFDRFKRYDLAAIKYFQVLKVDRLFEKNLENYEVHYIHTFLRGTVIGGDLMETYRLPRGNYTVDRDINVQPQSTLTIAAGTILNFANSLGMLIQGEVRSEGTNVDKIVYTLAGGENEEMNHTSVRLVDGANRYEGRVEVQVNEQWGTVCSQGWSIQDAAIVCQQLGMTIHPHDWIPQRRTQGVQFAPIWLSNVDCNRYSKDILHCEADGPNDHTCDHSMDVNIRCQPKTWGGVHLTVTARSSKLIHMKMDKAGLLDYSKLTYGPAIQIDYNEHYLSNLDISECRSSGILVVHNNPFKTPKNKIVNVNLHSNLDSGIVCKSPFIDISEGTFQDNHVAGFTFNPTLSTVDASRIRKLLHTTTNLLDYVTSPLTVSPNGILYGIVPVNSNIGNHTYMIEIQTQSGSRIHIELLDYNPDTQEEHVTFYSGRKSDIPNQPRNWTIEDDLVDFPVASEGQYLTLKIDVMNGALSGRLTMVLRAMSYSVSMPPASIELSNLNILRNNRGVVTTYYNNPSNEHFDIFFRHKKESFTIKNSKFRNNKEQAVYIPSRTKYHEHYMPTYKELEGSARISEITYRIDSCEFLSNGLGIVGDHNHVEFSNNVWNWTLSRNVFRFNLERGYSIDLPLIGRNFRERDLWYDYQDYITANPNIIPDPEWWNQNSNWDPNNPNTWHTNDAIRWMQQQILENRNWKDMTPQEQAKLLKELHRELWFLWHKVVNHTVLIESNTFQNNRHFEFRLAGYYAKTVIRNNSFVNNVARVGVMTISGMEKLMDVRDNVFTGNTARYIVDFALNSHYEFEVTVPGHFRYNKLKYNRLPPGYEITKYSSSPETYALGVNGVQNVTVTRNLFGNSLQFECVAGVQSAWLENAMDLQENWWGTTDQLVIREKIFDFDDWNNFAIANFYPYLIEDRFDSPVTTDPLKTFPLDISKPLGGRIEKPLVLPYRREPYIIQRDLTVMPDALLEIKPGVQLQFWPNVGLLVLGRMVAIGEWYKPIDFRPFLPPDRATRDTHQQPVKRAMKAPKNVQVRFVGGNLRNEGFVEMFNETVYRWELICDPLFNERTGRVICRELQLESSNVIVKRTYLYDSQIYGYEHRSVKYFWDVSYQCNGDENTLDECLWQPNYKKTTCAAQRDYVFLRCGPRNILAHERYWGNLRFASTDIETIRPRAEYSYMQHVNIYGAGILHGTRVAAIQSTYQPPVVDRISITNCAYSACDYVAPRFGMTFSNSTIKGNLGHGLGYLNLNGESRDVLRSSFQPLVESIVPYNAFGLVRMCDSTKEITIKNRLIVYYKYDYKSASCSKILRSKVTGKRVAFRLLQFNLLYDNFSKNAIELFNGDYFSNTSAKITEILPNAPESEINRKYETSGRYDVLGIHLHASAAPGTYGFIAEVVTLPLSPLSSLISGRETDHTIESNKIVENQGGAVKYMNVGEVNPNVLITKNYIKDNGLHMLNITAVPMIDLNIQNSWRLQVANNYIYYNRGGGIHLYTYSVAKSTGLHANISNNFLDTNSLGEVLHINGTHYQEVHVRNNYLAHNRVENRDVIYIAGVAVNFTHNVIQENVGSYIMNVSSYQKVGTYQHYIRNYMFRNRAIGRHHSTMFVTNSRMRIQNNFFYNRLNDFELTANNRTIPITGSLIPVDKAPIDARDNWWGSHNVFYIQGRMWDYRDDWWLIKVDFYPYHKSNNSVLEGRCPPGWVLYEERCYIYIGGAVPFDEAKEQCRHEGALLADSHKDRLKFFVGQQRKLQSNYRRYISRSWVSYSGPNSPGRCTVVREVYLEDHDCNTLLPFFCEKDPYPNEPFRWLVLIIVGCVLAAVIILIIIIMCCWYVKSKGRTKQRLERRNSMRVSRRSNRSLPSTGFNSYHRRGKKGTPSMKSGITAISGTTLDFASTDSLDKKLDTRTMTTPSSTLDRPRKGSSFYDTNDNPYSARLENEIANVISRPMYDAVYDNQVYDDSLDRRRLRHSFALDDIDLYDDEVKAPLTPTTMTPHNRSFDRPPAIPQRPVSMRPPSIPRPLSIPPKAVFDDDYEQEPFRRRGIGGYTNSSFDESDEKNLSDFDLKPDDVQVTLKPKHKRNETDI